MRVQYISSACVLVEHNGIQVLCDPWLTDGIYYGSWYHYPPLTVTPETFSSVHYIYISHVHPDHLDPASLQRMPKHIPVIIHDFEEKFVHRILKNLGFETIIEVPHGERVQLNSNFSLEILAADNCDPALCGRLAGCMPHPFKRTLQTDTLAVFHAGNKTVVNTNDCPYPLSSAVCDYIVQNYKTIDLLLVGYGGAGPYPQCFDNLDEPSKIAKGFAKRSQFLNQTASYLKHLQPAYFLPFAGQYTLGGKLAPLNPWRGVPELHELHSLLLPLCRNQNITSEMILLNSLEWFDVNIGEASAPYSAPDAIEKQRYINEVLSRKLLTYEEATYERLDLTDRLLEAQHRMLSRMERVGFRSDWRVYLDTGQEYLYCVPYDGSPIHKVNLGTECDPFVRISLDYSLLCMILDRKAHWNNAEIGSHLRFYRKPDIHDRAVMYYLYFLHC